MHFRVVYNTLAHALCNVVFVVLERPIDSGGMVVEAFYGLGS